MANSGEQALVVVDPERGTGQMYVERYAESLTVYRSQDNEVVGAVVEGTSLAPLKLDAGRVKRLPGAPPRHPRTHQRRFGLRRREFPQRRDLLKGLGSEESRAILRELAEGAPDARLTQEAKRALVP